MRTAYSSKYTSGFTLIEAAATVVVGGIFILAFVTLYISVTQSFARTRNQAVANDLSYSYLRKYASAGATPTWFTCDTSSGSSNTNDLTVNNQATGQVLTSGSLSSETSGLPSPVTYSVKALAIYGCSGANLKKPIRVDAVVTYGPGNITIRHSTIVGY